LSFHPLTVYLWLILSPQGVRDVPFLGRWTSPIDVLLSRLLYLKKTEIDFPFLVAVVAFSEAPSDCRN
jgi:hypothetical protein